MCNITFSRSPSKANRYSLALRVHTSELRDVDHLPHGITQCYLPPDTSERAPPNPSLKDWYSIYHPGWMEGWVDLVTGYIYRTDYRASVPARRHAVTDPSINRDRPRVTCRSRPTHYVPNQPFVSHFSYPSRPRPISYGMQPKCA